MGARGAPSFPSLHRCSLSRNPPPSPEYNMFWPLHWAPPRHPLPSPHDRIPANVSAGKLCCQLQKSSDSRTELIAKSISGLYSIGSPPNAVASAWAGGGSESVSSLDPREKNTKKKGKAHLFQPTGSRVRERFRGGPRRPRPPGGLLVEQRRTCEPDIEIKAKKSGLHCLTGAPARSCEALRTAESAEGMFWTAEGRSLIIFKRKIAAD